MIPSTRRLSSHGAQPIALRPFVAAFVIQSPNNVSFVQSVRNAPSVVTEMKYTSHMMPAKIGSASQRFVTIRSILSEVVISPAFDFFFTVLATSL